MKIDFLCDGTPHQGRSSGIEGKAFLVTDPPRGRPIGGGGVHQTNQLKGTDSKTGSEKK